MYNDDSHSLYRNVQIFALALSSPVKCSGRDYFKFLFQTLYEKFNKSFACRKSILSLRRHMRDYDNWHLNVRKEGEQTLNQVCSDLKIVKSVMWRIYKIFADAGGVWNQPAQDRKCAETDSQDLFSNDCYEK